MELYTAYSQFLSSEINQRGLIIISHTHMVSGRAVRKRLLNLLCTYTKICKTPKLLIDNFLQPILNTVLGDFVSSVPELREAEAISLVADLTNQLGKEILPCMEIILGPFLDSVLTMLVQDFTTFPEHRSSFFELLKAVTAHCFEALLQLPLQRLKIAIDTVLWASKHHTTSHTELG